MKSNKKIKNILGNARLLLLLIVLFGLFFRLISFSGMGISDSLRYSRTANDISEGRGIDPSGTLTVSTRLGLVYPTIFFYKLFGINDFSSVIFVLLTSTAGIVLIFYFGKLLFSERTGLMAAFLLSFFPLDVAYATQLLSDLPSAFFMAFGVYIFLHSEIKNQKHYSYCLFSGILIGIGYMIRESALLIALFFITYILHKKRIKKEYFLVPLGILIVFIAESFLFWSLTGDPLFRTHTSQEYLEDSVIAHNYFGRLDFPIGLLHYPWLFLTNSLLSPFYILIFIATIYFLAKKKKETYEMMFWLVPLLLYLSFGSSSLAQYIPFVAKDRYTFIITLPGILLLAVFLNEKKEVIRKGIVPFAILLLLIASVSAVYFREDRHLLDNLSQTYIFLKNLDKPVYTDIRSLRALGYISKYDNKIDIREYPNDLTKLKDVYAVINLEMIRNLREANKNRVFPKEIDNPPKNWKAVKETGKVEEDKIIVYFVQ